MRVGILDILSLPSSSTSETISHFILTKQYASVTPQAVSVWCRQLGHDVHYATYYGVGDPARKLPRDLDVLFVASYTQASGLAYAIGKMYRQSGALTVIGGPHAKAFPHDCLRFFDLAVMECDKERVREILDGHYDPGAIVSSKVPFDDLPTVEERMPEIRRTAMFWRRWRTFMSSVPMLASMGCPYTCNFCIDWNNPYRLLPKERMVEDLRFLAKNLPGTLIAFHDPNFGVKFDQTLSVLETLPPKERLPYVMESSLSILREARLERLKETNCVAVAPGIESWTDYSGKGGAGGRIGLEKVGHVAEHFRQLNENVPYLQANFIFGLDTDAGDGPIELTTEFMDRTPYVWPTFNIPVPFGGTPLYDDYLATDRILKAMPFTFYYTPYLAFKLKHYDPASYYERFVRLLQHCASRDMLRRRVRSTTNWKVRTLHRVRTAFTHALVRKCREVLGMLKSDAGFRAFHEGKSETLPAYYYAELKRRLGAYAELLTRDDLKPNLQQATKPTELPIVQLT